MCTTQINGSLQTFWNFMVNTFNSIYTEIVCLLLIDIEMSLQLDKSCTTFRISCGTVVCLSAFQLQSNAKMENKVLGENFCYQKLAVVQRQRMNVNVRLNVIAIATVQHYNLILKLVFFHSRNCSKAMFKMYFDFYCEGNCNLKQ